MERRTVFGAMFKRGQHGFHLESPRPNSSRKTREYHRAIKISISNIEAIVKIALQEGERSKVKEREEAIEKHHMSTVFSDGEFDFFFSFV